MSGLRGKDLCCCCYNLSADLKEGSVCCTATSSSYMINAEGHVSCNTTSDNSKSQDLITSQTTKTLVPDNLPASQRIQLVGFLISKAPMLSVYLHKDQSTIDENILRLANYCTLDEALYWSALCEVIDGSGDDVDVLDVLSNDPNTLRGLVNKLTSQLNRVHSAYRSLFNDILVKVSDSGKSRTNESFKYGGSHTTTSSNENIINSWSGVITPGEEHQLPIPVDIPMHAHINISVACYDHYDTMLSGAASMIKIRWNGDRIWNIAPVATFGTMDIAGTGVRYGGYTWNFTVDFQTYVGYGSDSCWISCSGTERIFNTIVEVNVCPNLDEIRVPLVEEVSVVDNVVGVQTIVNPVTVGSITSTVPVDLQTFPVWTTDERPDEGFTFSQVYQYINSSAVISYIKNKFRYGGCNNTKGNCQTSLLTDYLPQVDGTQKPTTPLLTVATPLEAWTWYSSVSNLPTMAKVNPQLLRRYVVLIDAEFEFTDAEPLPLPVDVQITDEIVRSKRETALPIADETKKKWVKRSQKKDEHTAKKAEQMSYVVDRLSKKVNTFDEMLDTVFGDGSSQCKVRAISYPLLKTLSRKVEISVDQYGILAAIIVSSSVDPQPSIVVRQWGKYLKDNFLSSSWVSMTKWLMSNCVEDTSPSSEARTNESFKYGGSHTTSSTNENISSSSYAFIYGGCNNTKGNEQTSVSLFGDDIRASKKWSLFDVYQQCQPYEIQQARFQPLQYELQSRSNIAGYQTTVVNPLLEPMYRNLDTNVAGGVPCVSLETFETTAVMDISMTTENLQLIQKNDRRLPDFTNDFGVLIPDLKWIPCTSTRIGCQALDVALKFLLNLYCYNPILDADLGTDGFVPNIDNVALNAYVGPMLLGATGQRPHFPFQNQVNVIRFFSTFEAAAEVRSRDPLFYPLNMATNPRHPQLLVITAMVFSPWPNGVALFTRGNNCLSTPWDHIAIPGNNVLDVVFPMLQNSRAPDNYNNVRTPSVTCGNTPYGIYAAGQLLNAQIGNLDDPPGGIDWLSWMKTWFDDLTKDDWKLWFDLQPWFSKEEFDFALFFESNASTFTRLTRRNNPRLGTTLCSPFLRQNLAAGLSSYDAPPYPQRWGLLPRSSHGYLNLLSTRTTTYRPGLGDRGSFDEIHLQLPTNYWSRCWMSRVSHASVEVALSRYGVIRNFFDVNQRIPTAMTLVQQKCSSRLNMWKGFLGTTFTKMFHKLTDFKCPVFTVNADGYKPFPITTFDLWNPVPLHMSYVNNDVTEQLAPQMSKAFILMFVRHVTEWTFPDYAVMNPLWKGERYEARGGIGPWYPMENIPGTSGLDSALSDGGMWLPESHCKNAATILWSSNFGGLHSNGMGLATRFNQFNWAGNDRIVIGNGAGLLSDAGLLSWQALDGVASVYYPAWFTGAPVHVTAAVANSRGNLIWTMDIYLPPGKISTTSYDGGNLGTKINWNSEDDYVITKSNTTSTEVTVPGDSQGNVSLQN